MIDKDGKVFGKINIIDLLIVLVIVAAIAVAGFRAVNKRAESAASNAQRVRITFFGDYVNDFLPDALTIGDPLSEYSGKTDLGTLVSFSVEPAKQMVYNEYTNTSEEMDVLGHVWMTFTCETTGVLNSKGFTKDDVTFVVGGNYYINIGPTRTGCQLKSFELVG